MFHFGKDYVIFKLKKLASFLFKLAVTLFALLSVGSMWLFFN